MASSGLTHLDSTGTAHMVDVSHKNISSRTAVAEGFVLMKPQTLEAILNGNASKGDVLGTARIAGIMAAKKTSDIIPLCHPLMITKVSIDIDPEPDLPGYRIVATVHVNGQTGVEMEALTAVTATCLTIYDMAKAVDKGMTIQNVRLLKKQGGKSGDYIADPL